MSELNADTVTQETVHHLEIRLRRIQYVLTGDSESRVDLGSDSRDTIAARLRTLDRNLTSLTTKSTTAAQVLKLQRDHASVFHPALNENSTDGLPSAALASIVLAHAQSYELMHKQLGIVSDLALPSPAALVPLVELQTRIDSTEARQNQLSLQVASLRSRSASLLESWYTSGVLDMSEQWTDWEERLRDIEILVRRLEAAKKREDGFV